MMYLAVFVGGAAGSLLREVLPPVVPVIEPMTSTFAINIVACLAIGWLYAVRHKVHAHVMHLGAVGFCGGLSTFSAFAADLLETFTTSGLTLTFAAAGLEIVAGIAAAVLGESLGRRFHGPALS